MPTANKTEPCGKSQSIKFIYPLEPSRGILFAQNAFFFPCIVDNRHSGLYPVPAVAYDEGRVHHSLIKEGMVRMAKAILICGKICSGKTWYAKSLLKTKSAVLLSSDEITLALFGPDGGQAHGAVVERLQKYLYQKTVEIVEAGINVILDWGFWTQKDRREATAFLARYNVAYEWHYIDTPDEALRENLKKRNNEIAEGRTLSYYFPDDLVSRFWNAFEAPTRDEMDIWVANRTR